jgi:hypothetical protein
MYYEISHSREGEVDIRCDDLYKRDGGTPSAALTRWGRASDIDGPRVRLDPDRLLRKDIRCFSQRRSHSKCTNKRVIHLRRVQKQ